MNLNLFSESTLPHLKTKKAGPQKRGRKRRPREVKSKLLTAREKKDPYQVKPEPRRYATRPVDTKEMISVRLDHKTVIFVKPGTDIEAIKAKYANRHRDYPGIEKTMLNAQARKRK